MSERALAQLAADRAAAGQRVDQRIADYVEQCRKADLARQKRPVSSWINPTVIAAWRGRQADQKGSGSTPSK